ncbi:TPA: hypothetical protein ACGVAG_003271 [Vibrio vulnificus]
MSHQQITVSGGVVIQIIARNIPRRIIYRSEQLVLKIVDKQRLNGMRAKVIQRKKRWLSYRVNHNYRLLVRRSCCHSGPYYCVSHDEFEFWAKQ